MKITRNFTVLFVMLLLICSCATTPKQKQVLALDTFNGLYEQYLDEYDRQPEAIQAKWRDDIDPYWAEASLAIDSYVKLTNPDTPEGERKMKLYEVARDHALRLLITYGVEIKEE